MKVKMYVFEEEDKIVYFWPDERFVTTSLDKSMMYDGLYDSGCGNEEQFSSADSVKEIDISEVPSIATLAKLKMTHQ